MDNTTTNVQGREIKFKVWEIAEKRFVDYYSMGDGFVHVAIGDQYYLSNNLNAPEEHKESLRKQNIEIKDEFILLQFTGLRDKSGKEIYEGDILSYDYEDHDRPYPDELKKEPCYIVKYDPENNFHLGGFDVDRKRKLFAHASRFKQTEILGNIYEHPHLLKSEGLVVSEGLIDHGE